ncbi:MAG: substrate-binding domain-containing protein [Desulfuromonadales bacterium]|nr:substrate-binding domain-containing protein [Desulfuromonadales bacterium]
MKQIVTVGLMLLLLNFSLPGAQAAERQVIAGAGPSTNIVKIFVDDFAHLPVCTEVAFEVPEKSTKHAGGIKCSDYNVFGRTGRPLNEKEKAMDKGEVFLAKAPVAFAVGAKVGVSELSIEQLKKIFARKITNWKDVGGADLTITLAGREPTEALFLELKQQYDFFNNVEFDFVMNKDHHIVSFLHSPKGESAIAFGAKPNFGGLNIVTVDNFSAGVRLGLVYDLSNSDNPLVVAAKSFAKSPEWQKRVEQAGMIALH